MKHWFSDRRYRVGLMALGLLVLNACGAEDKTYTPTQDTVESKSAIAFNPAKQLITITDPGPVVTSEIISPCSIGFEETEWEYTVPSGKQFTLGVDTLTYVRDLESPASVTGVPSALFAVWSVPSRIVDGVTYQVEVEIQAKAMIYRNICTR